MLANYMNEKGGVGSRGARCSIALSPRLKKISSATPTGSGHTV